MKKGMMVMTIVASLSFLVSMIAVAPLFAVEAPKTTPTTKKQAPAPAPKMQKQNVSIQGPKAQFWDVPRYLY